MSDKAIVTPQMTSEPKGACFGGALEGGAFELAEEAKLTQLVN